MPPTRLVGRICAVLLLLAVPACSAGPSDRPAVAQRGEQQQVPPDRGSPGPRPLPPLGPQGRQALDWHDCTASTSNELDGAEPAEDTRFSCARMTTAVGSDRMRYGGTMRIALLRVGTGGIPLVVVNDIRGEPGTTFAARLATQLPEEMLREFTLIGVDRRGSGESDPLDCVPPADRATLTGFDPRAESGSELDELLDSARSASNECLLDLERRAQTYDTRHTAEDLEELRVELGVPRLHVIGRGEGSRVLTTYARRYPDSVGRMVLDGVPDPVLDPLARAKNQARSAERTFDRFAQWCRRGQDCALDETPRELVQRLLRKARESGLSTTAEALRPGEVIRAVLGGLAERNSWPRLGEALAAADDGDATELASFVRDPVPAPTELDARMITRCNDTMVRLPPERATDVMRQWVNELPLFGGVFAQELVQCSPWPRPQEALPSPGNGDLPPVPVITTEHDPFLPAQGGEKLANSLTQGITVNWLGSGHGALGRSDCVTGIVERFFGEGSLPAPETTCPA